MLWCLTADQVRLGLCCYPQFDHGGTCSCVVVQEVLGAGMKSDIPLRAHGIAMITKEGHHNLGVEIIGRILAVHGVRVSSILLSGLEHGTCVIWHVFSHLALCSDLPSQNPTIRGKVKIESTPGEGTTCHFLPETPSLNDGNTS